MTGCTCNELDMYQDYINILRICNEMFSSLLKAELLT
ncbi:MAG: hypothetical protein JWQ21_2958 [Herminiimonas sp.]|nr:hypothetical protein [Herminiimonas sp.]